MKAGMLADDDRTRLVRSNREQIPVVVGALTAYIHPDAAAQPQKSEPWYGMGLCATWNEDSFWLAADEVTVEVPWLSAVRVWVPGTASEEEIKRTIQAYSLGAVERPYR